MNSINSFLVSLLLATFLGGGSVHSHGHIVDPTARNLLWTDDRYPNQPHQPFSQELWCAPPQTLYVTQDQNFSQCGLCGDALSQPTPRDHEHGGTFGLGNIAKTYRMGDVINVTVESYFMHFGLMEYDLCSDEEEETPECFKRLQIVGGTEQIRPDDRMCASYNGDGGEWKIMTAFVKLPEGVRCRRCTLRWSYRTNFDGYNGWYECGIDPRPAQAFRNCADVAII